MYAYVHILIYSITLNLRPVLIRCAHTNRKTPTLSPIPCHRLTNDIIGPTSSFGLILLFSLSI